MPNIRILLQSLADALSPDTGTSDGFVDNVETSLARISQALPEILGGKIEAESLAAEYDDQATYDIGDYCTHNGVLYICATAVTTAESWDSAKWVAIPLIEKLKEKLDAPADGAVAGRYLMVGQNGEPVWDQLDESDIRQSVYDWMSAHPEAIVVNDGTITRAKLDNSVGQAVDEVSELKADLSDLTDGVADVQYVTLPRTMSSGYVINPDGSVASASSGYYVSNEVDISEYSVLKITARANYARLLYAFYDANSTFISGEASNGGESSTQITDKKVCVPNNAKYIRASMSYNVTPYVAITGEVISVKGFEALSDIVDDITSTESYQTDTIESVTYESGYVNRGGASGSGNYVHTNKIPVNTGDRIYLVFAVSGNLGGFRFVTAYNESDTAVYASGAESTTTAGYTVPEGIKSVILSLSGTDTSGAPYNIHIVRSITQNVIDTQSAKDMLFGKKWCVCGDSFSYGGQSPMPVFSDGKYAGCRKVYPYFIGNRTHINIVDFTGNGRTLAYPSDGSFSNSLTNPSADYYYQNIPSDTDYITIYLGINDSHHAPGSSGGDGEDNTGVIPIGTIDDATTATFGGAWNEVLSWLITNRPNAHIGIIVSNGVDNVNYRNLTIAIAKKYGVAYIDLNGDERTPAMIRTVNPDIAQAVKTALINKWAVEVGVNTHPNTDAHEYESFFIENFLRSI